MLTITDYSERAIALTGNTKSIKDQLKNMGGRFNSHLSCGAGWIFSKKREPALREFLASLDFSQSPEKVELNIEKDNCEEIYKKTLCDYKTEYPLNAGNWVSTMLGALKIRGGYLFAQKPTITTHFYFRDEGPNYDLCLNVCKNEESKKEYFYSQNLKQVYFSKKDNYFIIDDYGNIYIGNPYKLSDWWKDKQVFQFSTEELKEVENFYEWQKQQFKKRLDTYIKRYGVEKLSFNTYWADR